MRHAKTQKRVTIADPVYKSRLVTKFINTLMKDGRKTVAQDLVYGTLSLLKEKGNTEPLEVLEKAVSNVGPRMEVKARRVGGASYQVPTEVRGDRKATLAIRWIITAARARSNKDFHTFQEKFSSELLDASNNQGEAIKKRDNALRAAEANKAFAHFRW